ncbi:immunoglobulin-binding protein 1-like [Stegodyphus dumicola]|uniref:immunoglobulin-binding protein 1-like n=1 Tax=Stegodyphus dumicola TaxID=202533 RepID=UPI0015B2CBD7|nr:immunoglobulin-binding protein 1-like [Stegodyphus dumicola]
MTSSELSLVLQSLTPLEEKTVDDKSGSILSKTFDSCCQAYDLIQDSDLDSSNTEIQGAISQCIKHLELCTHMVNELNLFSSNEAIGEVQTSSLKYLLLPALLGSLNLQVQHKDMSKRLENLHIAEVYFKDFLLRCRNYELCTVELPEDFEEDGLENGDSSVKNSSHAHNVLDAAIVRERKIQQYKRTKELEKREKELKPALVRPDAEEFIREYYMILLEKWIMTVTAELETVKTEKNIVGTMVQMKDKSGNNLNRKESVKAKPLKTIIITKNEIQKKVFGMGYPSLPVMTIDDFYRQRFEKAIQEQKSAVKGMSLQEKALYGDDNTKEEEEIKKEELMEKDDPVELAKARQWNDWKDENPRGSGNRKNKG